jgi:hypothetical protein
VPKKKFTHDEIALKANINVPAQYKQKYLDILFKHEDAISMSNLTWADQQISSTKFSSRMTTQFTGNNSKFLKCTKRSLRQHWTNGSS